jgi:DNA repair protein RadD
MGGGNAGGECTHLRGEDVGNLRENNAGIFSAGMGRRDFDARILFASIDSIYKKSGEFAPFDFIFVDEAHRIPFSGEGKYRTFLSGCRRYNPSLRVIGWTATAWRMAGGQLCHPDHILTHLCYESKITELIKDGYLCNLRSKVGISQPDLSEVERYSGGDYKVNSLAKATNLESIVEAAVSESVRIIVGENRKYAIFYCVDISHAEKVSKALASRNVYAPYITSKTSPRDRDGIISDFKAGRIHAICNVNVLTEGFDAPIVDCIVLLRPTLSAGLFSQMVGRGLRLHPGKSDCLVLDFAGCIDEHGPIDLLGGQRVVEAVCQQCREVFSRALRACPHCGWEIPKREVERIEAVEKEKRMHGTKASRRSILSNEPETLKVDTIYVSRHKKPGNPDSVRLQFRCGLRMFRHWVCLDHSGTSGALAQAWWRRFHSAPRGTKFTVNEVLSDLFVSQHLIEQIHTITVRKNGKYFEVTDYNKPIAENAG